MMPPLLLSVHSSMPMLLHEHTFAWPNNARTQIALPALFAHKYYALLPPSESPTRALMLSVCVCMLPNTSNETLHTPLHSHAQHLPRLLCALLPACCYYYYVDFYCTSYYYFYCEEGSTPYPSSRYQYALLPPCDPLTFLLHLALVACPVCYYNDAGAAFTSAAAAAARRTFDERSRTLNASACHTAMGMGVGSLTVA